MGEAKQRGTFEQRKTMSQEKQQMDLEQAPMKIANTINECIMGGVPIPFILSTLVLISHDLAGKHIERTNAMHKLMTESQKTGGVKIEERATDVSSN